MAFDIDRVGAVVHVAVTSRDEWGASAQLLAENRAGTRVRAAHGGMSAGGQRRGSAAIWRRYTGPPLPDGLEARRRALDDYRVQRQDVEDAINQLLGRDPEQHHPPRLSWDPLIACLLEHGVTVTEDELIAMPFVFECSEASSAALER